MQPRSEQTSGRRDRKGSAGKLCRHATAMDEVRRVTEGVLVVLEGGEGAGKTTLAHLLAERARASGRMVSVTREPGGTVLGEVLRGLLHEDVELWTEVFMFMAARAELVGTVIRPRLADGHIVICDRYTGSTLAYQGYGRNIEKSTLRTLNEWSSGGLEPNLVLYLDVDPSIGLSRKVDETRSVRTGLEQLAFHQRVREGYLALAATDERWITLDAGLSQGEVFAHAWDAVERATTQLPYVPRLL